MSRQELLNHRNMRNHNGIPDIAISAGVLAALVLLLLAMTSCAHFVPASSPQAVAAQSHLDQVSVKSAETKIALAEASTELGQKPTPNVPAAQAAIGKAVASNDGIPPLVVDTKAETLALSNDRDAIAAQWNAHKDDLKNYEADHYNDWLGPRSHRWIIYICIVVSMLGIGYVFLIAAGEMEGGALAGAITVIGHVFTFGLKFIGQWLGKAAAWVLGKISSLGSSTATVLAKASPNPPVSAPATIAIPAVVA